MAQAPQGLEAQVGYSLETETVTATVTGTVTVSNTTRVVVQGTAATTTGAWPVQVASGTNVAQVVAPSSPTAAYGTNGLRVIIGPTDPISNIPVTIPYDHHQIHEGETWHLDKLISNLASGSTYDIVFTVPNITIPAGIAVVERVPHLRWSFKANDLCTVQFYAGPTVTAATGSALTPVNYERNGTYTSQLTVLDAPTVTVVGTLLKTDVTLATSAAPGGGSGAGGSIEEWVLKNNTQYLLRVTSGNNGMDMHLIFLWYEDKGV